MKFLKTQWQKFLQKSLFAKFLDIVFYLLIVAILIPEGRVFLQQTILKTGLFGNIEKNKNIPISTENWNWKLADAKGNLHLLNDFKGQKIFINTWATWCPPCNAEMPYIIELMQITPKVKFLFVTNEKPEKVDSHLAKKGWEIPVYYQVSSPQNELNYSSLPTTFIINEAGVLIHQSEGMKKWNSIDVIDLLKN